MLCMFEFNLLFFICPLLLQPIAHECFELGRTAYNAKDGYHAILWLQEAFKRLEKENWRNPNVDKATILDYLSWQLYLVWLI